MAALLMDENMPRSAGRLLADAGHDVVFVADVEPAADDRSVLALARTGQRVLVTFDADFGDLIFQQAVAAPPAVVYLRLHPIDTAAWLRWCCRLWQSRSSATSSSAHDLATGVDRCRRPPIESPETASPDHYLAVAEPASMIAGMLKRQLQGRAGHRTSWRGDWPRYPEAPPLRA